MSAQHETGHYTAGTTCTLVKRWPNKQRARINIAPENMPARMIDVSLSMIEQIPKPAPPKPNVFVNKHGTVAGRNEHVRRGETVCIPCADKYNDTQRARVIRRQKTKEIRIPIRLFAELLKEAPEVSQNRVRDSLGNLTYDALKDTYVRPHTVT